MADARSQDTSPVFPDSISETGEYQPEAYAFPHTTSSKRSSQTHTKEDDISAGLLRQRSFSLPALNLYSGTPLFPSPSSSYYPQPESEVEILRNLLSRDRIRRDQKTKNKTFKGLSKRSISLGDSSLPKVKMQAQEAVEEGTLGHTKEGTDQTERRGSRKSRDMTPTPEDSGLDVTTPPAPQVTPTEVKPVSIPTASSSAIPAGVPSSPAMKRLSTSASSRKSTDYFTTSSGSPSRPPSSYMPFLPELEHSPELSRRLSESTSRRNSRLSTSSMSTLSDEETQTPTVLSPSKSSSSQTPLPPVYIKDFAFQPTDSRFVGQGPTPSELAFQAAQNVHLHSLPEGVFEESGDEASSLSSSGNSGNPHFSWGFLPPHATSPDPFSTSFNPRVVENAEFEEFEEVLEEEEEDRDDGGVEIPPEGRLYKAAYPFVPEASQEMQLDEGEMVRVYERVCEGWVVACRLKHISASGDQAEQWVDDEETGLVPETYLIMLEDELVSEAGQRLNDAMSLGSTP